MIESACRLPRWNDYGVAGKVRVAFFREWRPGAPAGAFSLANTVRVPGCAFRVVTPVRDANAASEISCPTCGILPIAHLTPAAYAPVAMGARSSRCDSTATPLACLADFAIPSLKRRWDAARSAVGVQAMCDRGATMAGREMPEAFSLVSLSSRRFTLASERPHKQKPFARHKWT